MIRRTQFIAIDCMWVVVEVDKENNRERWTKGGWFSEDDAENQLNEAHEWEDWTPLAEASS